MKKVVLLLVVFFGLGLAAANAQSCQGASMAGKSCCANKAAKAAAADATIEKRSNEDGTVAYVRKETDPQGTVRFVSVQFDEASNAFVNAAPKSIAPADKATATKKTGACCAGGAANKSCAGQAQKSCAGHKVEQ